MTHKNLFVNNHNYNLNLQNVIGEATIFNDRRVISEATFTCTVVVRKLLSLGHLKVLQSRPNNNDVGSQAVKLQTQTTSRSGCHC